MKLIRCLKSEEKVMNYFLKKINYIFFCLVAIWALKLSITGKR